MPDPVLGLLNLCLLGLLYLFFVRVVWAVRSEVKAPVVAPVAEGGAPPPPPKPTSKPRRSRSGVPSRLVSVDPKGKVIASYDLGGEMTLGRSPGCRVNIDDTFASTLHARVLSDDRGVFVEDLGSTNGTFVNGERLTTIVALHTGDRIQVGATVLEAR